MSNLTFNQLNHGWNAEPNAPEPVVTTKSEILELTFNLNHWAYDAKDNEKGLICFHGCALWRLGVTNDEGWYRGQCRYSHLAPTWGKFYELTGNDRQKLAPSDWHKLSPLTSDHRHFLFYFRDDTFECLAKDYSLGESLAVYEA